MTLNIGFLTFPNVQQLDLTGPFEVFASIAGASVHLIWKDLQPARSATGLMLTPTMTFEDCPPLDVFCVPGGVGVNALMTDPAVLDFVRRQAGRTRYLTAVCTGSLVLGMAGLLQGRRATTHWNAVEFLSAFGAVHVDRRVVDDGDLITAGGVTSGIDFGLALVEKLVGRSEAEAIQLGLEYAPHPPFNAGTPAEASPAVLALVRQRFEPTRRARQDIVANR